MAQFPIKNALIQGTLDGTPASGTVNFSSLTLTLPTASLQIGTAVQAYDADLTTWAGVTPAAGITAFLTTPTSANLLAAVTNETGSGSLVFGTSPTLTTPTIASFTNATHNHTNAAGGGQLSLTTAVTGTLPVANGGTGATALPKFAAYMGSDQSIPSATMTKVNFNTEFFDVNSNYDAATNYRFTPTVAGKYIVGGHVYWGTTTGAANVDIFIRKNGSDYARLDQKIGVASANIMGGTTMVDMNGSTDYLEFFVYQDSGLAKDITASSTITQFWASMLP